MHCGFKKPGSPATSNLNKYWSLAIILAPKFAALAEEIQAMQKILLKYLVLFKNYIF